MSFCGIQLHWIVWAAFAFLVAALLLGIISAIKALRQTPISGQARPLVDGVQPIGPILEALKGLIEALGKAPAWFALFLAGLFLFWLAGETYVDACKPTGTSARTSVTKSTTTITRTVPRSGALPKGR